jgi:F420-0:gamma-glutamyl ligase
MKQQKKRSKNNAVTTIQQGDVLLSRITILPEGEQKVVAKQKLVLAEGEVTGHYHGIEESEAELIQIGNKMILSLENEATLTHQEHGHISVPAGLWEIGRVQEYDWFNQVQRDVKD